MFILSEFVYPCMASIELHLISATKYFEGIVDILKKHKSENVIYVTTNKPFVVLLNTLKSKKVDTKKMFFVDCISKNIGEKSEDVDNCVFLETMQSLTAISIAIHEATEHMGGKKLLLIDSLSILLMYNDANTVAKFSNFVMNKMRGLDVNTVVIALESDAEKAVLKQIATYADTIISGGDK